MGQFTFEEINLICCFKDSTADNIVANIIVAMPYMDKEIKYIAKQVISKLENYQDVDIQQLLECEVTD